MSDEEWRVCPRFPDYEVSSIGRLRRTAKRRYQHYKAGVPLKLWKEPKVGYLRTTILDPDGKRCLVTAHGMVAEAFIGPKPSPKHGVAHYDGDPANNDLANLRWATAAENATDAVRLGRTNKGDKGARARLRSTDIPAIRNLIASGVGYREIGRRYEVGHNAISRIANGTGWAHVP